MSPGESLALPGHFLESLIRAGLEELAEASNQGRGLLDQRFKLEGKTHAGVVVEWAGFVKSFPKNGIATSSESCWDP